MGKRVLIDCSKEMCRVSVTGTDTGCSLLGGK